MGNYDFNSHAHTMRAGGAMLRYFFIVMLCVAPVVAQQSGRIAVTVTDPGNRFVTALDEASFTVLENGSPRTITHFSEADSSLEIVVLSDALSLSDALRKLETS